MKIKEEARQDSEKPRRSSKVKGQSGNKVNIRWAVLMVLSSFLISVIFNLFSTSLLEGAGYLLAFFVLIFIVFIGVLFDIFGTAITSASEAPFHSMAARKVKGAPEGLKLIRNAEKASNFCNDVVGDIASIVSGATCAVIVERLTSDLGVREAVVSILLSAMVAAVTVGGKYFGKAFALAHDTKIVFMAGRIIAAFTGKRKSGKKKKQPRGR